jgi:SAM-dependent methyltransferase
MSASVPEIFDRTALRRNRARAAKRLKDFDFLLTRAADDLADRLMVQNRGFDRALCLGCSTGYLAREMAARGALGTKIKDWTDADIVADMLPQEGGLLLDEEALGLEAQSYDLIISFWGLHHVNDLPGALVQIRQALTPDGVFLAALPGNENLRELRAAFLDAESTLLGGARPHIHPFADLRDLAGLMQRAGFALPVADSDVVNVRYQNPLTLLRDLRGMGESNILTQRSKAPLRRDVLAAAMAQFTANNKDGDKTSAQFEICYLAGFAPAEGQAKKHEEGEVITRFDESAIMAASDKPA